MKKIGSLKVTLLSIVVFCFSFSAKAQDYLPEGRVITQQEQEPEN